MFRHRFVSGYPLGSRHPLVLSRQPLVLSRHPPVLFRHPRVLSRHPIVQAGDALVLSGDALVLSRYPLGSIRCTGRCPHHCTTFQWTQQSGSSFRRFVRARNSISTPSVRSLH